MPKQPHSCLTAKTKMCLWHGLSLFHITQFQINILHATLLKQHVSFKSSFFHFMTGSQDAREECPTNTKNPVCTCGQLAWPLLCRIIQKPPKFCVYGDCQINSPACRSPQFKTPAWLGIKGSILPSNTCPMKLPPSSVKAWHRHGPHPQVTTREPPPKRWSNL